MLLWRTFCISGCVIGPVRLFWTVIIQPDLIASTRVGRLNAQQLCKELNLYIPYSNSRYHEGLSVCKDLGQCTSFLFCVFQFCTQINFCNGYTGQAIRYTVGTESSEEIHLILAVYLK